MTIAPVARRPALGIVPAPVRRALIGAPIGQQPLVEAALAWQRLPPVGDRPVLSGYPGYLPIVETADEQVAARVARLLAALTFSVIARTEGETAETRWRIDIPLLRHGPVTRTLSGVWRRTLRHFGPDARFAGTDRDAAISLWRIAALIAESEPAHQRLCVRPGNPATGALLVTAAARLGVRANLRRLARRPAVLVEDPDQVRLLLATVLHGASPWPLRSGSAR
jgi:hypothetical protein